MILAKGFQSFQSKVLNSMNESPYIFANVLSFLFFFFRTLMPLYDPDTSMLFTPGKADRNLAFFEVSDANKVTLGNVKIFSFFFFFCTYPYLYLHPNTLVLFR